MADKQNELIPTPNYLLIKQNFLKDLQLASQGKSSSLPFIKQHLPSKPLFIHGVIQGIVIGGTNFVTKTEEINTSGTIRIINQTRGQLPLFTTRQTLADFFSEHLDPRADAVGLNFGFPLKPVYTEEGSLDGITIAKGTKDHTFTGLTEPVGTLVQSVFKEKYHKKIIISVANDTISLLLSGNGTEKASVVIGSGFNMCIRLNDTTLVNLEAGDFGTFTPSPIFAEIDAKTKNPGKKFFEKHVSGIYVPKQFNAWTKYLDLSIPHVANGQELSSYAKVPFMGAKDSEDKTAQQLAQTVLTHSASMAAAAIAATYEFFEKPAEFSIIGEGSLLWKGWHYQENLQEELKLLGAGNVTLKHIEDSGINGAIGLITKVH